MTASHKILERHKISTIPAMVDLSDLHDNRKLLSDKAITDLIAHNTLEKGRNKKAPLNSSYDISLINDEPHAIYKGMKSKKALGKGHFGLVKLAQNLKSGEWVVVKIIGLGKETPDEKKIKAYRKEVKFLKKIGQYIGDEIRQNSSGQHQAEIYMKLAEGAPINELISSAKVLPSIEYIEIIISILDSCENLLDNGILHRDLKDRNIMLELSRFMLQVVDYGLAAKTGKDRTYTARAGDGTTLYLAPEVLRDKSNKNAKVEYTEKTEIYALAITFARLLNLSDADDLDMAYYGSSLIQVRSDEFAERIPDKRVRRQIKEAMNPMANFDPNIRPTIKQCRVNFKSIHATLPELLKIVTVGCVNINDLRLDDKLTDTLKSLTRMDRVCIIEPHGTKLSKIDYVKYKRILEDKGMVVLDEVVRFNQDENGDDKKAQVAAYLKTLANASDRLYTPYFILSNHEKNDPTIKNKMISEGSLYLKPNDKNRHRTQLRENALCLDPNIISNCTDILKLEKNRLEEKQKQAMKAKRAKRIVALSSAIDDLSAHAVVRYGIFNKISHRLNKAVESSKSSNAINDAFTISK